MSILAFHSPERRIGLEIGPHALVQLEDAVSPRGASHVTTTLAVTDGGLVREFLLCLSCRDGGFDVAIELFSDDPAVRLCPVEGAERIYHVTLAKLWEDSVGHARSRAGREAQNLAALLAAPGSRS